MSKLKRLVYHSLNSNYSSDSSINKKIIEDSCGEIVNESMIINHLDLYF